MGAFQSDILNTITVAGLVVSIATPQSVPQWVQVRANLLVALVPKRNLSARCICKRAVMCETAGCSRLMRNICLQGQGLGLSEELKSAVDKFIVDNKVVLFMKGNRMFPQCGFSNTCVQV